eukprot:scaffold83358_cov94-Cyclotella_meneghiniana.AAC.3
MTAPSALTTTQLFFKSGNVSTIAAIEKNQWVQLTPEEKMAAQVLRYDESKWDNHFHILSNLAITATPHTEKLPPARDEGVVQPVVKADLMPSLGRISSPMYCNLQELKVVCTTSRNESEPIYHPMFAEYFLDGSGKKVLRQPRPPSLPKRPIATHWFKPDPKRYCGDVNSSSCANLGDELGPMLLLKLSGNRVIERRYEGMDVVVIGSVLNHMVTNYENSVHKLGYYYNVTVWGTGTKGCEPRVCNGEDDI